MELLVVSVVAFVLSFIFALGGIGAAIVLVPILNMLGIPFEHARAAGLFTNVLSTTGGVINNLKNKRIDWSIALPLTISSTLLAPLGAYLSHIIDPKWVGIGFSIFLLYTGVVLYLPKKGEGYREKASIWVTVLIGSIAGIFSGLLGVGGGSLVSPLLMMYGLNPKKVISSVIFMVPFSSFTGFLTYWKLGMVDWKITLAAALPAFVAGYIGTYIAHKYLKPQQIKKILGIFYFLIGLKFLAKWLGIKLLIKKV